jgi:hypothetical protein
MTIKPEPSKEGRLLIIIDSNREQSLSNPVTLRNSFLSIPKERLRKVF